MDNSFDITILGGGPGGYVAAIRASQLGLKTAIIEQDELGGVCLNWGCIPTKSLLKSAEMIDSIKNADQYGIKISSYKIEYGKIIDRSRQISERLSKGISFLMKKNNITHIQGRGVFTSKDNIEVSKGKKVTNVKSKHFIVATGGRPKNVPGVTFDGKQIISSKEAMILKKPPKDMVIIGGGAIGSEFAYFYNSCGTKITLIEMMDRILPMEDKDISKELRKQFIDSGIAINTNTIVEKVEKLKTKVKVHVKYGSKKMIIESSVVLVAIGITGNIEDIGLGLLGININNGSITIDDYGQTNISNIFAIGDVSGPPWLAHVASAQGHVAVEKIVDHNTEPIDYNNIPSCTYCQPQVASLGFTEIQAKEAGFNIKVGKFYFKSSGKALSVGKPVGFVKIIFDSKYGELLGCHIIGSQATELIQELVIAKNLEATWENLAYTMHPHPTLSESIMEAALDAYGIGVHQ
ncbi:MAG: dihydrolipoyl dehydrogenase [Candidatus Neomarinimicrobiota bacterium]|nr:dihydrolipoyl dehydrogenase [Candidatus Neomarinimicrobiota bacterium]